jgi:hypothetical protein
MPDYLLIGLDEHRSRILVTAMTGDVAVNGSEGGVSTPPSLLSLDQPTMR